MRNVKAMLAWESGKGKRVILLPSMSIFLRVPLGLAVMAIGFLIVWRTEKFQVWTGSIDWAEQKFGNGGTRFFLKLLGVGIAFFGIFIVTDIASDLFSSFASIFVRTPAGT